ncbi:beta-1 adrenergic receptor-like [Tubulanus polymorphus]|uniref:beta-1 adrenergic receptor-like n=1 Tax=Tubulanus polymorphus TaxID=672921 RepID=UPI003DA5DE1E
MNETLPDGSNSDWNGWISVQVVAILMLGLFAVFGNLVLVSTIGRVKSLQIVSNMMVVNLATTDLCVALVVLPAWAVCVVYQTLVFEEALCTATGLLTFLLFQESMSTLAIIAVDRYVCICHPFKYQEFVTRGKVIAVTCYTWVQSLMLSCLPLRGFGEYSFRPFNLPICTLNFVQNSIYTIILLSVIIIPSCVMIVFCYMRIFRVVRRQSKRVAAIETCRNNLHPTCLEPDAISQASNVSRPDSGVFTDATRVPHRSSAPSILERMKCRVRRTFQNTKGLRTIFTIMICFLFCWTPFIVQMICTVAGCPWPSYGLDFAITFLAFANSIANPLIFVIINRDFRNSMRQIFKRPKSNSVNNIVTSVTLTLSTTGAPPIVGSVIIRQNGLHVPVISET